MKLLYSSLLLYTFTFHFNQNLVFFVSPLCDDLEEKKSANSCQSAISVSHCNAFRCNLWSFIGLGNGRRFTNPLSFVHSLTLRSLSTLTTNRHCPIIIVFSLSVVAFTFFPFVRNIAYYFAHNLTRKHLVFTPYDDQIILH